MKLKKVWVQEKMNTCNHVYGFLCDGFLHHHTEGAMMFVRVCVCSTGLFRSFPWSRRPNAAVIELGWKKIRNCLAWWLEVVQCCAKRWATPTRPGCKFRIAILQNIFCVDESTSTWPCCACFPPGDFFVSIRWFWEKLHYCVYLMQYPFDNF